MKKLITDIIKNIEELFPDVKIDIEENTNGMVIRFGNGNAEHVKVTISGDDIFDVCLCRNVSMWRRKYAKDAGSRSTGEIVDIPYSKQEVRCGMTASEAGVFITAKVVYGLSLVD